MRRNSVRKMTALGLQPRSGRAGFTLVEALVAVVILSVGIVAVMASLGAMAKTEAKLRTKEVMQRLAERKYEELVATSTNLATPQSGDFQDWNEKRFTWSTAVDTTGVDNLNAITLTVSPASGGSDSDKIKVVGLVYIPPSTTTTPGLTTP